MKIVTARNVCQALPQTMKHICNEGTHESSRAGDVIVAPAPMVIVTQCPRERVLFSSIRDANPFFHLAEAIWMLAGRNDAKFLDRYVSDFSKLYAEEDGRLHDAYGYRWRYSFGFDQLDAVVQKLTANPNDRQNVIQMWDTRNDENNDLLGSWRSRPCNTSVFLRLNNGKLDMTVVCRSNDMLWGAHGSNAVHFSILQEYLAARIDAEIGVMYQLSNNAHIYADQFEKLELESVDELLDDRYSDFVIPMAMFTDPEMIDDDITTFMKCIDEEKLLDYGHGDYYNDWFDTVLTSMLLAHQFFKRKMYRDAIETAVEIEAADWRTAAMEWLERRIP
jgi:thymidylate synthase